MVEKVDNRPLRPLFTKRISGTKDSSCSAWTILPGTSSYVLSGRRVTPRRGCRVSSTRIVVIHTDGGREFDGQFQTFMSKHGVKRENTPPHTPQYNIVTERGLGILRFETVALLRGVIEGKSIFGGRKPSASRAKCQTDVIPPPSTTVRHCISYGSAVDCLDNTPTFDILRYL